MASIKAPENKYALDYSEQERIQSILNEFKQVTVTNSQTKVRVEKPNLEVKIRKLGKAGSRASAQLQYSPVFNVEKPKKDQSKTEKVMGPSRTADQVAQVVSIPKKELLSVDTTTGSQEESVIAEKQAHNKDQVFVKSQAEDVIDPSRTISATFNTNLPFPAPPTEPNKLVGMVLTPQNELIPGAIVEITDERGQVARAVKTNALGQFFITTPLKKGSYVVSIEKEGLSFSPQQIAVNNKPLDPMEIHSQ